MNHNTITQGDPVRLSNSGNTGSSQNHTKNRFSLKTVPQFAVNHAVTWFNHLIAGMRKLAEKIGILNPKHKVEQRDKHCSQSQTHPEIPQPIHVEPQKINEIPQKKEESKPLTIQKPAQAVKPDRVIPVNLSGKLPETSSILNIPSTSSSTTTPSPIEAQVKPSNVSPHDPYADFYKKEAYKMRREEIKGVYCLAAVCFDFLREGKVFEIVKKTGHNTSLGKKMTEEFLDSVLLHKGWWKNLFHMAEPHEPSEYFKVDSIVQALISSNDRDEFIKNTDKYLDEHGKKALDFIEQKKSHKFLFRFKDRTKEFENGYAELKKIYKPEPALQQMSA